ncbi:MAG: NADH-ubiquinone oxidoreductase-F iron-sulfur binding region domain-containing protein [Actinomycetota bacterium]|nr:NADH-ubiquinone oxidoreductase-F iron-sulfur binding region domain-containing protein [Actinomycetota bacterium]
MSVNDATHATPNQAGPAAPGNPAIAEIVRAHSDWAGGLMPALHAIQHHAGYIDRAHIPMLADVFNLSTAEVHGVVSFYTDFRTTPPAGPLVQVCRAEACLSRGGDKVWNAARTAAQWAPVEVAEVFCLGNCALGPTVAANGQLHRVLDEGDIEAIVGVAVRRAQGNDPVDGPAAAAAAPVGPAGPASANRASAAVVVYVPRDAAARAAGADHVAAALAAAPGVRVVRNGSRGMLWLEPMIEVTTPSGRVAYGPVGVTDVPGLLAAGLLQGGEHPLRLGPTEQQPWLARQQRVTFGRVGVVDPLDPDDFLAHGGLAGLRAALAMQASEVVAAVTDSGLRGRGGAAFPTGIKLRTVLDTPSAQKYIVCNADEGDSGSFADRMLMEGDPFLLIEGIVVAGWAVGATEGFIYIRSEYPDAIATMGAAIATAEQRGWLTGLADDAGTTGSVGVLGSDFPFRLHLRVGAGAYICGEETALMESIEGKRGVVRAKPPLPAIAGLWGKPTVINNVLSLAALPSILADGPAAYAALGTGRSRGTQVVQIAGNVARGGIFETGFGITVRELVEDLGGGSYSGLPVAAVQVGGPLGAYLSVEQLDLPIDYESFAAAGALLGHGSMVVFDDMVDLLGMARFAMEFCAAESCGKCTPCRIGSTRGVELIDKIIAGDRRDEHIEVLMDLCEVMADASLCAMGGFTPLPVRSALALHHELHPDSGGARDSHDLSTQGATA